MRPTSRIFIFGLALAACGPLSTYYKPGVSMARLESDTTTCRVKGLKDAPVANQVRQRPPVYYPGSRYCDANGCVTRPGYWVDGGIYTVDVNQQLRGQVTDQCMAAKGYQPVSVPRCSQAVARSAPRTQMRSLPRLTPTSCSIQYDDGTWQIVNPVGAASSN